MADRTRKRSLAFELLWGPLWLIAAFAVAFSTEAEWSFSTMGTALLSGGLGLALGLTSIPLCLEIVAFRQGRIVKAAIDRQFKESEPEILATVERHRGQIELEAVVRLNAAFDECQRTGKPVKVEIAGVEEYLLVRPPPGTDGPGRDRN